MYSLGSGRWVSVTSADYTVTDASTVSLVRLIAPSQATMTTQLLLQILQKHLNKWKFWRLIRLINVTAVTVY